LKRSACLVIASILLFSFIMIAPVSAISELALPSPVTPMKYDDADVESPADSLAKPLEKPVKPGPDPTAGKWAVVIGIADYYGRTNDLWNPDEDAKEMYSELVNQRGYPAANVKLMTNRAATASAILSAISWLVTNEKAGNEVVFFFSGHGFRAADSEDWDSDEESDGYDEGIVSYDLYGLPDGYLKEKFAGVESTRFALLFGSCHSGGMFDDGDDLQQTGRIIASACKADQYGWDYLTLGNTLWGYHFVDSGLLDNNANSIETAHAYAYPLVVAMQKDSQPQLYDGVSGDFTL
jgi:hypothetical protein